MHRIKHIIICDACGKTYTTYGRPDIIDLDEDDDDDDK